MKRALLILLAGTAICLAGWAGLFFGMTARHRAMLEYEQPELAWLQKEFQLNDAEFARIEELHNAYLPQCAAMCRRIEERNRQAGALLAEWRAMTPDIAALLQEAAELRLACQKQMMEHFLEVSRVMSPEQGRRYLAWVQEKTLHMTHESGESNTVPGDHGHHDH